MQSSFISSVRKVEEREGEIMKIFTGLMLLCIMPGVLSAAVYRFNIKTKKLNTEKLGKTVMFFILIFHGILSAAKSVLGEGNLTLIESFGDIEGATDRKSVV